MDKMNLFKASRLNSKLASIKESTEGGQTESPIKGYGNYIVNGALLGIVIQLAGLYTRLDGLSAIVGIFLLVVGILLRSRPPKPLPPPPSPSDKGYRAYRSEVADRRFFATIDFAAWGGAMVLMEVIAIALYFLFGFHFPVAPGIH